MQLEASSEREGLLKFVMRESLQAQGDGEPHTAPHAPPKLLCLRRTSEPRSSLHRLFFASLMSDRIAVNRVSWYQLTTVLEAQLDSRQRQVRGRFLPPSAVPNWKALGGLYGEKIYVFYELSTAWIA